MNISFYVIGKVQAVMFRKTFCFGAQKRGIVAGATNNKKEKDRVLCSLRGERELIIKFIAELQELDALNSWGAKVDRVEEVEDFHAIEIHEVTSLDLDRSTLSKEIEFYL